MIFIECCLYTRVHSKSGDVWHVWWNVKDQGLAEAWVMELQCLLDILSWI